ncbi:MAG: NAD(P)/FAD-dependent oxidoreductase [Candidatus Eremiobacteraeota bacterium]|nr:NAD(P)/FAD-dependent oxidoreductase [Candidatus Eremiobacteraeota bacterium]
MGVLHTLRRKSRGRSSARHPYVDTPDFSYDRWLEHLERHRRPLGSVARTPKASVAIVGAGVSGLCAAYELIRAGCAVTVFEQAGEVGGRCASVRFPNDRGANIAELGAMRFPPSQFALDFYLRKFGILSGGLDDEPDFPDPGIETTYLCYGGSVEKWVRGEPAPAAFATVANGWHAFLNEGRHKRGKLVLPPVTKITEALVAGDVEFATVSWQAYLDAFDQKTFYTVLYELFTGRDGHDVPGGTPWSAGDFDRFGALGLGSGGFEPLFSIGFIDIFRLMPNELETHQKFLRPTATLDCGIRTLPNRFADVVAREGRLLTRTPIVSIQRKDDAFVLDGDPESRLYDRVIVATTTRAMELTLNLTAFEPGALLSPEVARAIVRTHVIASNKVAARIKNFWTDNPNAVRGLQTEDLVRQVYTLDYTAAGAPPDPSGVCFISYVWDEDAVKQQAITSGEPNSPEYNERLYRYLLARLEAIGGEVAAWARNLEPLDGDYENNVVFEEWQSSPHYGGAFKLSEPGQDVHVQTMFFDYQKCGGPNDTGVYIAGDCVAWTSGWVEGAVTTALNAAAATIASLGGTLNAGVDGKTPLSIQRDRFNYFRC